MTVYGRLSILRLRCHGPLIYADDMPSCPQSVSVVNIYISLESKILRIDKSLNILSTVSSKQVMI